MEPEGRDSIGGGFLEKGAPRPIVARLTEPFRRFVRLEISSSLLLLAMTVVALLWANSPYGASYHHLFHSAENGLSVGWGAVQIAMPLGHWINDALMTIFFFVVGMEIKRELVYGELSSRSKAALPVVAALGGMVVPAGIYAYLHWGGPALRGWGIPMATDIAFAVAALSSFGSRVPPGLKVFLLALAIADDIGAVAVIAVFYTDHLAADYLAWAVAGLAGIAVLNRIGVRSYGIYVAAAATVWYLTHHSGVHATIAGVAIGFLTPARRALPGSGQTLAERGRHLLEHLAELLSGEGNDHSGHERHHVTRALHQVGRASLSPLDHLTNVLHPWVAFAIMPLFALANAGVVLSASTFEDPMALRVGSAVALGLLVGKPVGVAAFSWLAVKSGLAVLPRHCNWGAITAVGALAGIGFTVALFVTNLAFDDPLFTDGSKIGILIGSTLAALLGLFWLRHSLPREL